MKTAKYKIIFLITLILFITNLGNACPRINGLVDWNCDRKLKIIFLGDSTTVGGAFNGGFVRHLKESHFPNIVTVNNGVGGTTSSAVAHRLRTGNFYKNMLHADYVFITIGVNDWWHKENTVKNIRSMMKSIEKMYIKNRQTPPVIRVNIPLRMNLAIATEFNAVRRAGQDKWIFQTGRKILRSGLPIAARFDKVPVTLENFKDDGLHPIDNGYMIMAEILANYMKTKLRKEVSNR